MPTPVGKRCFTIMIVPHSEEATYSIRLPLYLLQIAVGILVLCVTGVSILGYAYLKAAAEAKEAYTLRQINKAQQEEIDALAVETQRVMDQIRAIDELVELITDRLELDPDTLNNGLNNQTLQDPSLVHSADYLAYDRSYSSRSSTGGVLERAVENVAILQNIIPDRSETLDRVGEYVAQEQAKPSIWPARGRLVSGFGMRRIPYAETGYQFHNGIDILGAYGSSIWTSAGGEVVFTGYRGSYGNMVIIDHDYGYETYYAHLSGFAVTAGDSVERGQTVGYMGASGRTTGTHLHYEVRYNGSPVNPNNYLTQ